MIITRVDLLELAKKIQANIEKEFEYIHVTGNLMDTIQIIPSENGFYIDIPADMYDLKTWYEKGLIVYTGEGSYAQAVNEMGGFSHSHTGYVEYSIKKAIDEFLKEKGLRVKEYIEI